MTVYVYLINRKIVTDNEGIIIESNVSTHPIGEKVDPKWLKAVGFKVKKCQPCKHHPHARTLVCNDCHKYVCRDCASKHNTPLTRSAESIQPKPLACGCVRFTNIRCEEHRLKNG